MATVSLHRADRIYFSYLNKFVLPIILALFTLVPFFVSYLSLPPTVGLLTIPVLFYLAFSSGEAKNYREYLEAEKRVFQYRLANDAERFSNVFWFSVVWAAYISMILNLSSPIV